MSEIGDMFKEHREAQRERRQARLPKRTAEIEGLAAEGFRIRRLTEFQFRVNDRLDLYPIHNRYHDIKRNKRGGYPDVRSFVRKYFAARANS